MTSYPRDDLTGLVCMKVFIRNWLLSFLNKRQKNNLLFLICLFISCFVLLELFFLLLFLLLLLFRDLFFPFSLSLIGGVWCTHSDDG